MGVAKALGNCSLVAWGNGLCEGGGGGQAVRVADDEPLEGEPGGELLGGGRAGDDGGDGRGTVQGREIGGVAVTVTLRRHDLEAEGDRPSEDAAPRLGEDGAHISGMTLAHENGGRAP